MQSISAHAVLPSDFSDAVLAGRVWRDGDVNGPSAAPGALVNHVHLCDAIPPWTFGIRAPYQNLAGRSLASIPSPSRRASA